MAAQQPRQPDPQAQQRANRAYQAAQVALVAGIAGMIHKALSLLDLHDLKGTTPKVAAAIYAVTVHYGRSSAALALSHYRQQRVAAGVVGKLPTLKPAPLPTLEAVTAEVEKAVSKLYGPPDESLMARVEADLAAATEQMILDIGRETTVAAAEQDVPTSTDRTPRRWAREVEPGCCYWCAMLATRGAVYHSARSAGEGNAYHDHCRCQAVPVFGEYEPTAQVRKWSQEYKQVTKDASSTKEAVLLWRRHFEGRSKLTAKPARPKQTPRVPTRTFDASALSAAWPRAN